MFDRSKVAVPADNHISAVFWRMTCMALVAGVTASIAAASVVLVIAAVGS